MATIYREADADMFTLAGRRVALLGAGELARGLALNLRDAGLPLVVGCTLDQITPFRVENFDAVETGICNVDAAARFVQNHIHKTLICIGGHRRQGEENDHALRVLDVSALVVAGLRGD